MISSPCHPPALSASTAGACGKGLGGWKPCGGVSLRPVSTPLARKANAQHSCFSLNGIAFIDTCHCMILLNFKTQILAIRAKG